MTTSRRFLNRLFLAVVGLVLLAVGAFLVLAVAAPGLGLVDLVRDADEGLGTALADTPLDPEGGTGGSWLPALLAAACLVVMLLALWAALAHGGGRTDRVLEHDDPEGTVVVRGSFAEDALEEALGRRRDVASVHVTTWRVAGAPALKVRVRATPGSSPGPIVAAASDAVRALDALLGDRVTVLVEVAGGAGARRASRVDRPGTD